MTMRSVRSGSRTRASMFTTSPCACMAARKCWRCASSAHSDASLWPMICSRVMPKRRSNAGFTSCTIWLDCSCTVMAAGLLLKIFRSLDSLCIKDSSACRRRASSCLPSLSACRVCCWLLRAPSATLSNTTTGINQMSPSFCLQARPASQLIQPRQALRGRRCLAGPFAVPLGDS